jgi:TonB family protein
MKKLLLVILLGVLVSGICYAISYKDVFRPPEPVITIYPDYPDYNLDISLNGTVELVVEVDTLGNAKPFIIARSLMSGAYGLDQIVFDKAKQWKFRPAEIDGTFVDAHYVIRVEFDYDLDKHIAKRKANGDYDIPSEVIYSVEPEYPVFTCGAKPTGVVILEVEVLMNGTVGCVKVKRSVMSGPNGLDEAAINAVKQWKFKPAMKDEKAITIKMIIPIEVTPDSHKRAQKSIKENKQIENPFDTAPVPINTVYPDFPSMKYPRQIPEGTVLLEVVVDKGGYPRNIWVRQSMMRGPGGLDEAAVNAVSKWKFKPAMKDGKAVEATVIIPIEFKYGNK